ncbi:LysE family translocator [Prosthecomicrobium sp. N25]|uniref:LysE family translocator n=1 Tax=Prosthecomicrobium sp. N25 TaxID=3129254 RepID=UPI0030770388
MLDIWLFLKGIGIGILFSAPVGPVNIMCIQLAFRRGFLAGFAAGVGAVMADGLFAAMAAYGVTAFADFVVGWSTVFQVVGGVVLILFGIGIIRSHPHLDDGPVKAGNPVSTALAAFGMTITNPATILGFIAVFGSLGEFAPDPGDYLGASALVAGVLAGGAAWWFLVASLVSLVRTRMTDRALETVNHGAGALLVLFGTVLIGRIALLHVA